MKKVDLIIIGGGPAGYETAIYAKQKGLSSIIIEKNELGGVCLNQGCIPTKAFVYASNCFYNLNLMDEYGIHSHSTFNHAQLVAKKNKIVADLRAGIDFTLKSLDIAVIKGEAKLLSNKEVVVNDEIIAGEYIIIAAGSKNVEIDFKVKTFNSDSLLEAQDISDSVTIIGGGNIGLEFASIYANFGLQVNVVEKLPRILMAFEAPDVAYLTRLLKRKGIHFYTNNGVAKIEQTTKYQITLQDGKVLESKYVIQCVGRAANVEAINCDDVGLKYTKQGLCVDKHYQTNLQGVFAIGDINGISLLQSSAVVQGRQVINYLTNDPRLLYPQLIPKVVYTSPTLAVIGQSEEQLKEKQVVYRVVKSFFKGNGYANATSHNEGVIRFLIDQEDYIVGASIIGNEAEELIHEVQLIIINQFKVTQLQNIVMAHPSLSEIIVDAFKSQQK